MSDVSMDDIEEADDGVGDNEDPTLDKNVDEPADEDEDISESVGGYLFDADSDTW